VDSSPNCSGADEQHLARELDGTGLYYYRARYYNPTLQGFISEDPIGLSSRDTNFYRYVWSSPTNFTDPFGTCHLLVAEILGGHIRAFRRAVPTAWLVLMRDSEAVASLLTRKAHASSEDHSIRLY